MSMKARLLLLPFLFLLLTAFKTDKPAYRLYNNEGKNAKYEKLLKASLEADVVLFGELHNNPIAHWLQYELTQDLYDEKGSNLVLGAEMFESDNQLLIDEYLKGQIREKNFESEVRLWNNYRTDYKPLLEFAKEKGLNFIATNIPRRYASAVFMGGFESLNEFPIESKAYFPPMPIAYDPELPGYKAMLENMGGMAGHGSDNLPKAQAIKDATMAWHILKNRGQEQLLLHYNGAYHSNNYEGIVWYLLNERPDLKIVTISTVEQEDISDLKEDNLNIADFIICVPSTMTKTH